LNLLLNYSNKFFIPAGIHVAEAPAHYGAESPARERLTAYLDGEDDALSFADVTIEELGEMLGEKKRR
jgi:hypothetical protein